MTVGVPNRYLAIHECRNHCLRGHIEKWNGFWPSGKTIDYGNIRQNIYNFYFRQRTDLDACDGIADLLGSFWKCFWCAAVWNLAVLAIKAGTRSMRDVLDDSRPDEFLVDLMSGDSIARMCMAWKIRFLKIAGTYGRIASRTVTVKWCCKAWILLIPKLIPFVAVVVALHLWLALSIILKVITSN